MIRIIDKIQASRGLRAAQNEIEDFTDLVGDLSMNDINDMRFWSAKIRKILSLKSECIEKLYKHPLDDLNFFMSINLINTLLRRNSIKLDSEKLHGTRLLLNSVYALHYPSLREKGMEIWKMVDKALDYKDHFYQSKINEGYELTDDFISLMIPPDVLMAKTADYTELFKVKTIGLSDQE
ncbi:hypothetical protein [Hydrogenovibrio kuenenii]|uniref:hypothetical protein n=1 Tax=Hydrogenovibrio kuenenii TaxID=63658 RepID=UPI000467B900|nr:hypothetical protein [Hydrogenovibrio kuenenii]